MRLRTRRARQRLHGALADRPVTGVLLVGGASRRFGSPKALARFGEETLAERGWRVLGDVCDERFAVGKVADGLDLPFPILDDGTELRAPIVGVIAGLRAASNRVVVFLPVDVPIVTARALGELADGCWDAAVPQTGPLPGAYSKFALETLEARVARGELALKDALTELNVRYVRIDPRLLVNVNTRADLRAIELWPGPEKRSLLRRLAPTPLMLVLLVFVLGAIAYGFWRYFTA